MSYIELIQNRRDYEKEAAAHFDYAGQYARMGKMPTATFHGEKAMMYLGRVADINALLSAAADQEAAA